MQDSQKTFNFIDTTATRKIFAMRKRIRAVAGGTSASKTISIIVWLIDYCQTRLPNEREKICTVVSESYHHLEHGAILDFQNIMKDRGYWDDNCWHETKHTYTFETGHRLEFYSVDTFGKAHGPRRDVLFVNECNNLPYNIVDQLITRTREVVWLDWNPVSEFWFYTDMRVMREGDIDFITLTYKDNEALDDITVKEIESHKPNKHWWTVYGLGELGQLEERVYKNWFEIETVPPEAISVRVGIDFGYTNDPTVIINIYKYNGGFVLDEVAYQNGMDNKMIADILSAGPKVLAIGDSSEPKSIAEIRKYGVNIIGAVKGKDSVLQGIQFVQAQRIYITKNSLKTLKAYRNYMFMRDDTDKVINVPDDTIHEWSNPMDAVRYGLDSFRDRKVWTPQTSFGGVGTIIEGVG